MHWLRWKQIKTKDHRAGHQNQASLIADMGLDAANHNRASGGRRKMSLTSPLIEQAITLFDLVSGAPISVCALVWTPAHEDPT
jgi:hypothetical protein